MGAVRGRGISRRLAWRWVQAGVVLAVVFGLRIGIRVGSVATGLTAFVVVAPLAAGGAIAVCALLGCDAPGDGSTTSAGAGSATAGDWLIWRSLRARLAVAAVMFAADVVRAGTSARAVASSLVIPVALMGVGWAIERDRRASGPAAAVGDRT